MSSGGLAWTTKSVVTVAPDRRLPLLQLPVEERESLFQIERSVHAFEGQPQLNHCERDFWLKADDDRCRAAQPRHVRNGAQGARCVRIHDVDGGEVDDDPVRT